MLRFSLVYFASFCFTQPVSLVSQSRSADWIQPHSFKRAINSCQHHDLTPLSSRMWPCSALKSIFQTQVFSVTLKPHLKDRMVSSYQHAFWLQLHLLRATCIRRWKKNLKWLMYCYNWGSAGNSDKGYQWRRFIQTPAWNFLIFAANLLSSRWLGSLRWMLIAQGPKRILLPGWRSVMNIVIWSHMPCNAALCSFPGWRSVCRQCWMFPVSETWRRREGQVPLVARWTLIHINRLSLSLSLTHTHTAFLSPIIYPLKDVHYTSHTGRKR